MSEPLLVTADETFGIASMSEYVDYVRDGYREHGNGAPLTARTRLETETSAELMEYMTVLPELGIMGGYVYSSAEDQWYLTPLFDSESGEFIGIVDGTTLSPYKTAAAAGVATDELAREDASSVLLFGSGPQGRSQVKAAAAVRDLEQVWVNSLDQSNAARLADDLEDDLDVSAEAVENGDEYVGAADIIITATNSNDPVFDGELLEPGTHVTAMGESDYDERELDVTTVEQAKYVADSRVRCLDESGEFHTAVAQGVVTNDHLHAELGEVVAGTKSGRTSSDEITVFDSGGTAIETVASGYLVLERAQETGAGTPLPVVSINNAPTEI